MVLLMRKCVFRNTVFVFFFVEEECYTCLASLVSSKQLVFVTQTKLLYEVTWKTVMQISRKHVVSKNPNSAIWDISNKNDYFFRNLR